MALLRLLASSSFGSSFAAASFLTPVCRPIQASLFHSSAINWRNSFYCQRSAQVLWKTNTSVSSQGRARGRAKGLIRIKNLNKGQQLGFGKAKISWPGLSAPVLDKDRKKAGIGRISDAKFKEYEDGVQTIRAMAGTRRGLRRKQTPLERGWAGGSPQGKMFGPPIPVNSALNYSDFESVLIEHKLVSHMTGNFGRVRRISMLMLTGNKKGLAGFALTKSPTGRGPNAFQRAVNRAGLKLCSIDLYEGRTVYHDFFTQFGSTRIFVRQKPSGFGVQAHRTIKAACKVIGIKDLEAVIEGAVNYNHIIKALFLGLMRQRSHQALADEKRLHLVELRAENDNFPRLVASPSDGKVRTKEEILPNEVLDFELISFEGSLPYIKPQAIPFFQRLSSWQVHLHKTRSVKHHYEQRIQMLADYGRVCSPLTDIYPECKPAEYKKKRKNSDEDDG